MSSARLALETVDGRVFRRVEPAPRTPLTAIEWCDAVSAAFCAHRSAAPSERTLSILWAQYALETARGERCYGFNLGNVMRFPGQPFDWCDLRTFEFVDGKRVDTVGSFRVYGDRFAGAHEYIWTLARLFPEGLHAAELGDARGFVEELKRRHYMTAPVDQYLPAIESLAREARPRSGYVCIAPPSAEELGLKSWEPVVSSFSSAATTLRAPEAEHTVRLAEPSFDPERTVS